MLDAVWQYMLDVTSKGCGKAVGKRNTRWSGWELFELLYHMRNSMGGALQEDLVPATLIEMADMVVMMKWGVQFKTALGISQTGIHSYVICRNGISDTGIWPVQYLSKLH